MKQGNERRSDQWKVAGMERVYMEVGAGGEPRVRGRLARATENEREMPA